MVQLTNMRKSTAATLEEYLEGIHVRVDITQKYFRNFGTLQKIIKSFNTKRFTEIETL